MKKLITIFLFFCCTHLHAQSDTTNESSYALHIRYFAVSNDSVRLSVVNADVVTIKQFKDHNTIVVYRNMATLPKKLDTSFKKHK